MASPPRPSYVPLGPADWALIVTVLIAFVVVLADTISWRP